jgi:hypothetical protein
MPFKSVIDTEQGLVRTTGTGILTGDDGFECCSQLKKRPDFDPSFNQLLDLTSAVQFDATGDDIQKIASVPLFSTTSRRAIVVSSPEIFGIARMFESYRGLSTHGEHIKVFTELNEAIAWLSPSLLQKQD